MKNKILYLSTFIFLSFIFDTYAQITRGAEENEIYISTDWYMDNYGDIHYAIFHSTDNGENITLKYENIENPPTGEMQVGKVIGDATPGAIYNYGNNELWVSFDYGVNWEFREVYPDYTRYWGGCCDSIIFKGGWGKLYKSEDFALTFEVVSDPPNCPISEIGYFDGEFYGIDGNAGEGFYLYHTIDYANTYAEIPIDSSVAYWSIGGYWPQISRGTQLGEIYLVSWWLNSNYKIFHSFDTGYSWTEKFESDYIDIYYWRVSYTAGREPGSFYVMRSRINPAGDHIWLYIDYSTDYGETFTTYFHDLDSTFTSINSQKQEYFKLTNYPNPFTDKTVITFQLPENPGIAKLKIYDLAGKTIKEYNINNKNQIIWNGTDENNRKVKSGIYFYIFEINGKNIASNKMIMKNK